MFWQRRKRMSIIAVMMLCSSPYPICNIGTVLSTEDTISHHRGHAAGLQHKRENTALQDYQRLSVLPPHSRPLAMGDTPANAEYRVSGDFGQVLLPNIVRYSFFCLGLKL